jgi:hypothetical protein
MAVNQVAISEAGNVQLSVEGAQETQIVLAVPGIQGPVGPGFPIGGTTNQVLVKISGANYDATWDNLDDILNSSNGVVDEGEYL